MLQRLLNAVRIIPDSLDKNRTTGRRWTSFLLKSQAGCCYPLPQGDPEIQHIKKKRRGCILKMFFHELLHGNIELMYITNVPARTFSLKMNDGCGSQIIIPESRFQDPVAEVYVFGIHKKLFIEAAGFIQHFFTDHHKGAG